LSFRPNGTCEEKEEEGKEGSGTARKKHYYKEKKQKIEKTIPTPTIRVNHFCSKAGGKFRTKLCKIRKKRRRKKKSGRRVHKGFWGGITRRDGRRIAREIEAALSKSSLAELVRALSKRKGKETWIAKSLG